MPNTYQFANENLNFTNHYSSSNDMFGLFGLFYGLPSTYASSVRVQGNAPLLIDVMKKMTISLAYLAATTLQTHSIKKPCSALYR